jgi:glycosyltransferase involved in cell wall biosynthesis
MSGASVNLLKIADHLVRAGHACSVFPSRPSEGPIEAEYQKRGIPILKQAVFKEYDTAICNTLNAGFIVSMAAPHTRPIWWIREAESGLEYILKRPEIIRGFYDAAAVVFQLPFQRDDVYRSFIYRADPAKFFLIPNGYNIARLGPAKPKTRPVRVITVGTIYELKRQGDLIRAINALDRPDIECVLIGKMMRLGEEEERIARAAPDRFKFLGELPHEETLAWLRSADILCHPSRSESQANIPFEAALTDNAIVAANLLAYRGIWRHGENALLHRVGDVEALAGMIGQLASDPALRARLARAAAETASEYTEERLWANVDRLLAAVCS